MHPTGRQARKSQLGVSSSPSTLLLQPWTYSLEHALLPRTSQAQSAWTRLLPATPLWTPACSGSGAGTWWLRRGGRAGGTGCWCWPRRCLPACTHSGASSSTGPASPPGARASPSRPSPGRFGPARSLLPEAICPHLARGAICPLAYLAGGRRALVLIAHSSLRRAHCSFAPRARAHSCRLARGSSPRGHGPAQVWNEQVAAAPWRRLARLCGGDDGGGGGAGLRCGGQLRPGPCGCSAAARAQGRAGHWTYEGEGDVVRLENPMPLFTGWGR